MSELGLGSGRGHKGRRGIAGCLAVLVALAIVVGLGAFTYVKGVDVVKGWLVGPADYSGDGHGSVLVSVQSGDTAADIGRTLERKGVVKSVEAFTDAAKDNPKSLSIQVGYYRLRLGMSGKAALVMMLKPSSRVSTDVTIPEGMRAKEILAALGAHTRLSPQALTAAFADTLALGLPSYANGDAEGYLYPATYPVDPGTTAAGMLKQMTARFRTEAAELKLTAGAKALHVSPTDIVIVASLVQAEASRPQDMPKVARVIYNRLKAGMPLQLDSTLHYAVDSRGVVVANKHLRSLKTPYNTYLNKGLPPTAIDSPGEMALKAALTPAKGSWLYFVTVNLRTGETLFATTYAEHEQQLAIYRHYCETSPAC